MIFFRAREAAAWLSLILVSPQLAYANPVGGVVVGGSATIAESGNTLDVHQATDRAVIDWRGFDIGASETTNFHQPTNNSVAVNRVTSGGASQIMGKLNANGNVVLLNPNGVVFGAGSQVDVNGLVASTANVSTANAMNGHLQLDQPGNPNAAIINNGTITAKQAGLVGLVAPNVTNNGTITANLGRVHLASGDTATVDLYGDQLMEVAVSDAVRKQTVTNTGTLQAAGGKIALTSAAGKSIVDSLITVQGEVKAPSVGVKNGEITIFAAGKNAVENNIAQNKNTITGQSRVVVDGTIDATGDTGGTVKLLGDHVTVKSGSSINVSGKKGGGKIHVGGEFQGKGATPTAITTTVEQGASLKANAEDSGNGGEIINWSDGDTSFHGNAEAMGGTASGDGGLVEVSGLGHLDFNGYVNTLAEHGADGLLLLDPTNITISSSADAFVNGATPFSPNADDAASNLDVATLVTALGTSNVTVQTRSTGTQLGDITVSNAISSASTRTLTLNADNDILINAPISVRSLTLTAGNDVGIASAISSNNSAGTLTIQQKNSAQTIGVAGGAGTLNVDTTDLSNVGSWGTITLGLNSSSGGNLTADTYDWTSTGAALNMYGGTTNAIAINGAQTLAASKALTMSAGTYAIAADLNGTGALALNSSSTNTWGIGTGAAGTANLDDTELGHLEKGWSSVSIGGNTSGQMEVMGHTWLQSTSLGTGTGLLKISGAQDVGVHNLTLTSDNFGINANLSGTGGTLSILPRTTNNSFGIGTGAAGTVSLSDAMLNKIQDGWGSIVLGTTSGSGNIEVASGYSWNDVLTIQSLTGNISLLGSLTMNAGNNLTLSTDRTISIGGALTGTGALTLKSRNGSADFYIGNGSTGTGTIISDTSLGNIATGWGSVTVGGTINTGTYYVNQATWNSPTLVRNGTGTININGAQTANNTSLQFTNSTGNINLNSTVTSDYNGLDAVIFAITSTGTFTNTAGTAPVTMTNGGRWLVYVQSLSKLVRGGMTPSASSIYSRTYAGNAPATIGAGNRFLYANAAGTAPTLSVTADNFSRYYGSNAAPGYTYTVTGFQGDDTTGNTLTGAGSVSLSGAASALTTASNAGTTAGGMVMSLGTLSNLLGYSLSAVNGNYIINPALLTVSATANSKTYNGQAGGDPALAYTYSGLVNGEMTTTFSGGVSRTAGNNAGTYTIGQGTLASSNGNYTIGTFNTANFVINPATITVTATNKSKFYGGVDPALTYTTNGDGTETFTGSLIRASGETVAGGTYAITQNNLTATGNYDTIVYNAGTFTINPALLTVTVTNGTKVYGDGDPALAYTYTGLTNGDTGTTFSGGLIRAVGETVAGGPYAITQNNLASSNSNYTINTFNAGSFTITAAPLTVTAANKTKVYGDMDPALTYTYSGLTNGDMSTTFGGALTRAAGENVAGGPYAITQNNLVSSNSNYAITSFNAGSFSITAAPLTVTATSTSKTYGTVDPTFAYTYGGLTNGDTSTTFSGALGRAAGSNAAAYSMDQGTLASNNSNYSITGFNAGTFTINPALLTVTATNKAKTYNGQAGIDPALTYTTDGDGTETITGSLARAGGNDVGSYAINQNSLAVSGNYSLGTFNSGTFSITAAPLTVSAVNNAKTRGTSDPALSYTYTGLVGGEPSANFTGAIARSAGESLGFYTISRNSLNATGNYTIGTFNSATFTINPVGGTFTLSLPSSVERETQDPDEYSEDYLAHAYTTAPIPIEVQLNPMAQPQMEPESTPLYFETGELNFLPPSDEAQLLGNLPL